MTPEYEQEVMSIRREEYYRLWRGEKNMDLECIPLLDALNDYGVRTFMSCSGHGSKDMWIDIVASPEKQQSILNLLDGDWKMNTGDTGTWSKRGNKSSAWMGDHWRYFQIRTLVKGEAAYEAANALERRLNDDRRGER
jgi:hypothetical protein